MSKQQIHAALHLNRKWRPLCDAEGEAEQLSVEGSRVTCEDCRRISDEFLRAYDHGFEPRNDRAKGPSECE